MLADHISGDCFDFGINLGIGFQRGDLAFESNRAAGACDFFNRGTDISGHALLQFGDIGASGLLAFGLVFLIQRIQRGLATWAFRLGLDGFRSCAEIVVHSAKRFCVLGQLGVFCGLAVKFRVGGFAFLILFGFDRFDAGHEFLRSGVASGDPLL